MWYLYKWFRIRIIIDAYALSYLFIYFLLYIIFSQLYSSNAFHLHYPAYTQHNYQ